MKRFSRKRRRPLLSELLEARRMLAGDWGDAPAPYPTLDADNGANHGAGGPLLGTLRDEEADGQPTLFADGDDTDAQGNDDDGVVFGKLQVGIQNVAVTFALQNVATSAFVNAWIDFNGDGSWDGPHEHIVDDAEVPAIFPALNSLFDVPSWAVDGPVYARVRVSTESGLGPGGRAEDGEVEDYRLTIHRPAQNLGIFDTRQVISDTVFGASSVAAADFDNDGDMDAVSTGQQGNVLAWHENNGSQSFSQNSITTTFENPLFVHVNDVNGDGAHDIMVAFTSLTQGGIAWFENDGTGSFTQRPVPTSFDVPVEVISGDIDSDGDVDLFAMFAANDEVAWYENDGSENFTERPLNTVFDTANIVRAGPKLALADVDSNGFLDFLIAAHDDDRIAWIENNGQGQFTQHDITQNADGARAVAAADINGDGATDVISASSQDNTISWYQNDGSQNFTKRDIDTNTDIAGSVFPADLDGDGDMDIMTVAFGDGSVSWHENDGTSPNPSFTRRVINSASASPETVFVADVDSDGDLDMLTSSLEDNSVAWYENILIGDYGDAPAPYPTLQADGGAMHGASGPRLGDGRDIEPNGQPDLFAEGDDFGGGDDEDGLTVIKLQIGAVANFASAVDFTLADTDEPSYLDIWIDFNRDGSWSGPFEHVADSVDVTSLSFKTTHIDVPAWAHEGETFMRVRVSSQTDLGPTGPALQGEVEDYRVTIDSPAEASGFFDSQNVITNSAMNSNALFGIDVNSDNQVDVVGEANSPNRLSWYESNGLGGFTEQLVPGTTMDLADVFAADINGDGRTDLLSASALDDRIAWYPNDGANNFSQINISTPDLDGDPHNASNGDTDGASLVRAADIDRDGDLDVVFGASDVGGTSKIGWYENTDGSGTFGPQQVISRIGSSPWAIAVADINRNGHIDVISTSPNSDTVVWHENDGQQGFSSRIVSIDPDGAGPLRGTIEFPLAVISTDVDRDGDQDLVVSTVFEGILWLENTDGLGNFGTPQVVSNQGGAASTLFASDIDGNGTTDILSASQIDDRVSWYLNDGSQVFHRIDINNPDLDGDDMNTANGDADGAYGVFVADMDNDGDLDVLSSSIHDNKLAWYENKIGMDYGDAPNSYGTTQSNNGASHFAQGPRLGTLRDAESNGQPTIAANGDNTTDLADEDGVTFAPTIRVGQVGILSDQTDIATEQQSNEPAYLDGWIDFDGDGSFGGPREHVANLGPQGGSFGYGFAIEVPAWAASGETYARFRTSTQAALGPVGPAENGEVEDYRILLTKPQFATGVFGEQNVIDSNAISAKGVVAADFDRDGDIDVASVSSGDSTVAWYEDGQTKHVISQTATNVESLTTGDINGDGFLDIVAASADDVIYLFLYVPGNGSFLQRIVSSSDLVADSIFQTALADLDLDGDLDIVAATNFGSDVVWFENDGSSDPGFGTWTPHTVNGPTKGTFSVTPIDLDRDGDIDLAVGMSDGLAWFQNDGSQNFTFRRITTNPVDASNPAVSVVAADLDRDGDQDLAVAFPSGTGDDYLAWYSSDGAATPSFTEHIVTTQMPSVRSVIVADINGDTNMDLVAVATSDDRISWFANDGTVAPTFEERIVNRPDEDGIPSNQINGDADRPLSVFAADFDDDGDIDLLSASEFDNKIAWYENLNEAEFGDAPHPFETSITAGGAAHVPIGPTLGTQRDAEVDGQADVAAAGDDNNGLDDGDGVTFGTLQVGQTASVDVDVRNLSLGGSFVDVWVDFNGDGDWGGPLEHVVDSFLESTDGLKTYSFPVPSWAEPDGKYARVRIQSATRLLGPDNIARDGEVEDYLVNIVPAQATDGDFLDQQVISSVATQVTDVTAADLDEDGVIDIIATYDDSVVWYDGSQNFQENTISSTLSTATSGFVADVNGDGLLDVLATSFAGNRVVLYLQTAANTFVEEVVSTTVNGPRDVTAADVDDDGDLDVVTASLLDNSVRWYERTPFGYAEHIVATVVGAASVTAADVDRDGRIDLLSSSQNSGNVLWHRNIGGQQFSTTTVTTNAVGATSLVAAHINGDSHLDIVVSSFIDNRVLWYRNNGNGTFSEFVAATGTAGAQSVFAVDLDGDRDMDILSASQLNDRIAWHKNDGQGVFTTFDVNVPDADTDSNNGNGNADTAISVFAADVDGDGDLDPISASFEDNKIAWYPNTTIRDFGDAPASYGTTLADGGARHRPLGIRFGNQRDIEIDGPATPFADGDDNTDVADEDGISFNDLILGSAGIASLNIQNASDFAKLDAWIDFDQDGTFDDPRDRVFSGLSIDNGLHDLAFPIPSNAVSGETFARFRVSTAGSATPIGSADDGEVQDMRLTLWDRLIVVVPPNSNPDGFTIRQNTSTVPATIEIIDVLNPAVPLASAPVNRLHSAFVIGADNEVEFVSVDFASGGHFSLPGGIGVSGGFGNGDELFLIGTGSTRATYQRQGATSLGEDAVVEVLEGSETMPIGVVAFESISASSLLSFDIDGELVVDATTLAVGSSIPVNLGGATALNGGTIVATGGVSLGASETLFGFGVVNGKVAAVPGSQILATGGNLTLGDAASPVGFHGDGELNTQGNTVTIQDSNEGVLGALTTIGTGGTLASTNGLLLTEGRNLIGDGTINGPFHNDGDVTSTGTLTFNGLVVGIGDYSGTVVFSGGSSFGHSPAQVSAEDVIFTTSNTHLVELGGLVAGSEFDRLDVSGSITIDGTLQVQFIDVGSGHSPSAGDSFEIISTVGGVNGTFATESLPALPTGLKWEVQYTTNVITLVIAQAGAVVDRRLFYNNSAFDNVTDDAAIANKVSFGVGDSSSFANYTSYASGINGLMVDLAGVGNLAAIDVTDFAFRAGRASDTSTWTTLAAKPSLAIRAGEGIGGADRMVLTWPDGTIKNTWLEIRVLANADTGLAQDDTFYFGNQVGDANGDGLTNATDFALVRANPSNFLNPAAVDNLFDMNRDGLVNASDLVIVRDFASIIGDTLPMITPTGNLRSLLLPPETKAKSTTDKTEGTAAIEQEAELQTDDDTAQLAALLAVMSERKESNTISVDSISEAKDELVVEVLGNMLL